MGFPKKKSMPPPTRGQSVSVCLFVRPEPESRMVEISSNRVRAPAAPASLSEGIHMGLSSSVVLQLLDGHAHQHVFPWRPDVFTHPCSLCHWLQLVQKAVLHKHILTQRAASKGSEEIGRADLRAQEYARRRLQGLWEVLWCDGIQRNRGRFHFKLTSLWHQQSRLKSHNMLTCPGFPFPWQIGFIPDVIIC